MKSRFSIILIACILIFFGIIIATKKDSETGSDGNYTFKTTDKVRGDGAKGVTLTEYGDFECPACGAYYPIVEQVFEKYKGDIKFEFRNFPLRQIHQHAMVAHRAAAAADDQGKFWDMYNLLYQNQETWKTQSDPSSTFRGFAESLKLDMPRYDAAFKSNFVNDVINKDLEKGQELGITGTPTFFIDGKKIESPKGLEDFSKAIDEAIKAKSQPQ